MNDSFSGELRLSYGDAPYDIHLEAKGIGGDVLAAVTGGTRAHIGAVALAEPAGAVHPVTGKPACCGEGRGPDGKEREPRVSTLIAYGHKDAVIAEMFARGLCKKYGVNICAAAGVHVDGAGQDEIALMIENAERLLGMV